VHATRVRFLGDRVVSKGYGGHPCPPDEDFETLMNSDAKIKLLIPKSLNLELVRPQTPRFDSNEP